MRQKIGRNLSGRRVLRFWLIGAMAIVAGCAASTTVEDPSIDGFKLVMQLFGGLALFLFGIDQMSDGLKAVAGKGLATLLSRVTRNRFLGAVTGAFVTAVLNSSSVTTVLVVGFITAGIMNLQQSIGVIMGANIGSTVTAQIVAFNVTQYAMLPIAIGFGMIFFGKSDKMKRSGAMLFGLGLLFGGMGVMSEAMYPLRSYEPFLELMSQLENPLLGVLVGAVFTGLVQSSAATTGIAIVMASEGLMSLPAGIALALGANIGTCVTAVLAAIGKPVAARRAAAAHILFNVVGVLIWLPFIDQLAQLAISVSPSNPELTGSARMAAEVPRQIANAHTLFNVINTAVFIWFTTVFARLVVRLVPDRERESKEIVTPKYLDENLLGSPSLALEATRFEVAHLGELAVAMVRQLRPAMESRDPAGLDKLERMDDQVDVLHEKIVEYLGEIHKEGLTDEETEAFLGLMRGADEVERIGDVVESDLIPLGRTVLAEGIEPSETTQMVFHKLYERVCFSVENAVRAVADGNEALARDVIAMKAEINGLIAEALRHQAERVAPTTPDLIAVFRMEDEYIDSLKRIYSLAKRLAKLLLPPVVAAKEA
jgi:phosphate:Na+ symporter